MLLNTKKIWLAILISVFLSFLLVVFGLLPILTQVKASANGLGAQKSTIALLERQISILKEFQQSYPGFIDDFQNISNAFVNQEMPISFIEFLEDMARENNLKINVATSPVGDKAGLGGSLNFKLNLIGSPANCLRFLEQLENSPWFLDIYQLQVERLSDKSGQSGVALNLSLSVLAAKSD